jgi:hypothetical protein
MQLLLSDLEIREYGPRDPSRWTRGTHYPQKFALTSPTNGCRYSSIADSGHGVMLHLTTETQAAAFPTCVKIRRGDTTICTVGSSFGNVSNSGWEPVAFYHNIRSLPECWRETVTFPEISDRACTNERRHRMSNFADGHLHIADPSSVWLVPKCGLYSCSSWCCSQIPV